MVLSPGKKLRSLIEGLGLDQIKIADTIGVTRQTINNIVNDRQPISRDMANRLARLTGRTPGYWLQSEFREFDGLEDAGSVISAGGGAVLVDHQIRQAIDSGIIGIDPFDLAQVQAASLDLRLGDLIIPAGGEPVNIAGGQTFSLYPGQTVNVQTRESVHFPADHIGRVGAITQVARFGIIMAHGFQIDPNYHGHLQFCLFNASSSRFELVSGASIISLEVTRLGATPSGNKLARESGRDDVQDAFGPAHACAALVREWLASYVETSPSDGRFIARIRDLEIELADITEENAVDSAVTTALVTFHSASGNSKLEQLRTAYQAFFAQRARHLYLDHDAVLNVARVLEFAIEGDVVVLPNGRHLSLPQESATIALDMLAARLGRPPDELVLPLTRMAKPGSQSTVTPFRARG